MSSLPANATDHESPAVEDNDNANMNQKTNKKQRRGEGAVKLPSGCRRRKEVSLYKVMEPDFIAEDRWMPAVLLSVKKNELSRGVSLFARPSVGHSKFSYGSNDPKYDRIMLLGCLSSGTCFAVLCATAKRSGLVLKSMSDNKLSIGQAVALLEPRFTGKSLGRDYSLPILDVRKPFEPYLNSEIPAREFVPPEEPGTRFFWLHEAKIRVVNAVMMKGTCGGYLCDGQGLRIGEKSCSCCLYTRAHPSYVLQVDVTVFDEEGDSEIFAMDNFSSWNLTRMFVPTISQASKLEDFMNDHEKRMRTCIKAIVKYVNDHGGWDVGGWMRRGMQVDATEKEKRTGEEVSSESVSPHIIHLYPTIKVPKEALEVMSFHVEVLKVS